MFYMLLVVLSSVLVSVYGLCQNVDGQSVSWWILFQQKERPYFHNYIDSTNSQRIKDHYPERNDSVLSRSMASVIHNNEAEYIIYSSDLINVKDIATKFSIPTYSKWMHGILGTVSSWESGFWIIHNNLLFPALTNGALAVPGSKAWFATTVGDSTADVFYICLTADNKGNMTEMLKSIMAGNPFLYKKRLQNYDFLQPYLKEVRVLQTSFGYEMSAEIFLNCMHTSSNNVSTNCLFTYAVTTGVGISIFTRPRGMIKHSSAFCYDDQSISSFDFLKLEKRSPLQSGFSHSMFALSDKTYSSVTGITCFGQDIAANAETIAVMICAHLPTLYVDVIKSTRLTQWSCNNKDSKTDIAGIYIKGQTRHRTNTLPDIKPETPSAGPTENDANEHNSEHINGVSDDTDEKDVAKFCQMYDCDNYNNKVVKQLEVFNINSFNNQILKNQKMTNRFNEMVADITMQYNIENPQKIHKGIKQVKKAIKAKGTSDVNQFLLQNERAVLGLFCQEGCRFCQNAKEHIILLANRIQIDYLDFVLVDIMETSLPDYLQVPFTPYIRYKFHGSSKWIDYSGKKFDIEHILLFLHTANTAKSAKENVNTDKNESTNTGIIERKRRNTREFFEGKTNTFIETKSRQKRFISGSFSRKHLLKIAGTGPLAGIITPPMIQHHFNLVNAHSKKIGKPYRNTNSFITTKDFEQTHKKLLDILNLYYKNNRFIPLADGTFEFPLINVTDIGAILVQCTISKEKRFWCGYSTDVGIKLVAKHTYNSFYLYHFASTYTKADFTECIDIRAYNNNKGTCDIMIKSKQC